MDELDAADLAELGRDVDDRPGAGGEHLGQHGARHQVGAAHMHGEHPVEVGRLEVDEGRLVDDARHC